MILELINRKLRVRKDPFSPLPSTMYSKNKSLGTPPGVPTMKGATAEPENTHEGYNTIIKELGDHSVPDGWIQRPKRNTVPDTPPGPPVQWDKAEDPDDVQLGYGYVPDGTAHHEDIFFYHSDHLGSTSYITDAKANITQFDAYLPYGELLVDEHSSSEEMPYKFNGKEFDEETGLYYYGARYMNPRTSLWYGVEPMAEKYVSVGGDVYCAGNPVKFVDFNGKEWGIKTNEKGETVIFANIELQINGMDEHTMNLYKEAVNKEFNRMVSEASSNKIKGEINFNAPQSEKQRLTMNWYKAKSNIAGNTVYGDSQVNLLDAEGNIKSIEQFAFDNIHEILHTLCMPELTEGHSLIRDTELKHLEKLYYKTTPNTAPGIINNVMNYQINYIDGKRYKDQNPRHLQNITPGQLKFMQKEIKLQQKGEGKSHNSPYWMRY